MKKRSMMLVTSMVLAVLLIAGGTFAWFTATTEAVTNEFTAGTLDIKLYDNFEGAPCVNPGDCYHKEIFVENTGTKKVMVRIKYDFEFLDVDGNPLDNSVVELNLNPGWRDGGDGYLYYDPILNPRESTANVLKNNKICFSKCMNNDYQGSTLKIEIHADGMQTTNDATWADWTETGDCVEDPCPH